MGKIRVLYGDNNAEHLEKWGDVLSKAGYEVVRTSLVSEVRRHLASKLFDLAVLDLHWDDDNDIDDMSGLDLAREFAQSVPCIFLTGAAEVETVVKVLRKERGASAAVDFVLKTKGSKPLLEAVRRALVPRVFVVHGHDEEALLAVERCLERMGTLPIVLRDLPASGSTIIEKLDQYSNVSFAVVLLTPDDLGSKKSGALDHRPRARQNVVLELGFFAGKLGRDHVAILCRQTEEELELPSDFKGVLYIPLDPGKGWQLALANEMRAAGISVDLARLPV